MVKHYSENYKENYIAGNVYAITGGGTGFGRETAIEVVKMGGCAAIMGRRMERLQTTVDAIRELGKEDCILAFEGDVSKYEDNLAFVKATVEKFGKMDAFFANAGIMPLAPISDYEKALRAWEDCIDINFKGVLYGMVASYAQFKEQGYGHFLVTSSIHGNYPTNGAAVYAATKIAVRYLAHCLRTENPGLVKATVICPPGVNTNLFETVVSTVGTTGIFGDKLNEFAEAAKLSRDPAHPEFDDCNSISYLRIKPEEMVWSIMYALNQPRGVSVSEVTMHPGNSYYQL